jgi:uncharacterized protein YndB with AHSA1/START domain
MHGPDGTDYVNKTLYHEVETCAKLVYDHGGNDHQAPLFRVTALFAEKDGKTHLDMRMAFPTQEIAVQMHKFVRQVGGESTWDRLAEFLGKELREQDVFIVNRSFDAPLERMFELWTDPRHFSQWLPPTGFTMEFLHADIREGGSSSYRMTNGSDVTMYGRAQYLEVRRPDRLVYTQQFTDDKGNISRHPMLSTWPATMLTTVALSTEGPDQTRVTIQWEPHGETTPEEVAMFLAQRASMTQGWSGSFDKLETLLGRGA